MQPIHLLADNMITALGFSTEVHWSQLIKGVSGLRTHSDKQLFEQTICAALVDKGHLTASFEELKTRRNLTLETPTLLEKLFLISISTAMKTASISPTSKHTLFIFATTKGNIDQLNQSHSRLRLGAMAKVITKNFKNPNDPIIVSNACISGLAAIILATRLLRAGYFRHAVVTGGDIVSDFTISGFHALKALSNVPCQPYDAQRKGINLGEGCGTMILSTAGEQEAKISILGGSISNDANHISGPSRTGEGLQIAIQAALKDSNNPIIDYISAHGTATLFNDEMEAKAFHALNLKKVPLNSFKGYWGHTLGAAGLLESIIACRSLEHGFLLKSKGYEVHGVSENIEVIHKNQIKNLRTCLKTSSGFGGCNAALVFKKND